MTTTDTMTGAELKTLREACGLTREDFGDMAGVQARSVKHWENGRAGVPGDVASLAQGLDSTVSRAAGELLQHAIDAALALGEKPRQVVLLRYSAEDAARYPQGRELASLGRLSGAQAAALQGAAINRIRITRGRLDALLPTLEGSALRIVWMQSDAYEAWRGAQGLTDSGLIRADWAAAQVAAQAKPHRADQPPAA